MATEATTVSDDCLKRPYSPEGVPWACPPASVGLSDREVHVWRACLNGHARRLPALLAGLSSDEQARAAQYRSWKDRVRFIAAHGFLRKILGAYAGAAPAQLRFRRGLHGKPELCGPCGEVALRFNMSYSSDFLLCAVARGRRVGLDVERIRPDLPAVAVARRFLSPEAFAALRGLSGGKLARAFFEAWTSMEARCKATGEGIDSGPKLSCAAPRPREASRWPLLRLRPAPGYAAALVVEGHDWTLRRWRYPQPGAARNI
ncbi:MAG: 4'-phosphopantetheinyl transferase superfamily protein [Planctomycetes bacterium]|nr:4'-phosphopantetheinyl transferase superfamily protein [Planctomycetota bacterium]